MKPKKRAGTVTVVAVMVTAHMSMKGESIAREGIKCNKTETYLAVIIVGTLLSKSKTKCVSIRS